MDNLKSGRLRDLISYSKRCENFKSLMNKYDYNYIPVVVDYIDPKISLTKRKYLIYKHAPISELLFHVRKQITTGSNEAIFLFAGNALLGAGEDISVVYYRYLSNVTDEDKFFYISIHCENTFG